MAPWRWIAERFRGVQKDLGSIRGPTAVRIEGHIASENCITSPMTGRKAALLEWSFFVRQIRPVGGGFVEVIFGTLARLPAGPVEEYVATPVRQGVFREDMTIACEGGTVLVPKEVKVELQWMSASGAPVDHVPPYFLDVLASTKFRSEDLQYREVVLAKGDLVELRAIVDALPATASDYRELETTRRFAVRLDLAAACLFQRIER